MATRYSGLSTKSTSIQNSEQLQEVLESRGLQQITHYKTLSLKLLTAKQLKSLTINTHTWAYSDRYWKLSAKYYGDPKYWWIIAWFNNKPIESMLNIGDQVSIPFPLDKVLGLF